MVIKQLNQEAVIQETVSFVKKSLVNAESGHNWWHIHRVWKLSKHIAKTENVNLFIVELGALLHDIADSKFYNGDEEIGPRRAREFLNSLDMEEKIIVHVENIIANISFKSGGHIQKFKSPELDVIQDADRLDAMGAIGIARAFNYGGYKNRNIYNPDIKPNFNMTKEEYRTNTSSTINHFYEKLFLLKDRINTETAKEMAGKRHKFIELFLQEFFEEWDGNK